MRTKTPRKSAPKQTQAKPAAYRVFTGDVAPPTVESKGFRVGSLGCFIVGPVPASDPAPPGCMFTVGVLHNEGLSYHIVGYTSAEFRVL